MAVTVGFEPITQVPRVLSGTLDPFVYGASRHIYAHLERPRRR